MSEANNFRNLHNSKHKRYLFHNAQTKKKRKPKLLFNEKANLEWMLMYDIDQMLKNDLNIQTMDEKTKNRLEEEVRVLYIKYIFEKDNKYIKELAKYTIPIILFYLKAYKQYFPYDFPDLIHSVHSAIMEEFIYLKWSLSQGWFITFITPRVKKFVNQFLVDYQKEQEQISRTNINEEKNFVVTFERVGKNEEEEIKENIQNIETDELTVEKSFKNELLSLRGEIELEFTNNWIVYNIISDNKFMLDIEHFIQEFNDIIINADLIKNIKYEITHYTKTMDVLKEVFVVMLEYNLFEKFELLSNTESREKFWKLYNGLKANI